MSCNFFGSVTDIRPYRSVRPHHCREYWMLFTEQGHSRHGQACPQTYHSSQASRTRACQARDSDFSKCHPRTVHLLSAGVVLVTSVTLWPLVWRLCEVRVREQTYLLKWCLVPARAGSEELVWTRRLINAIHLPFLPKYLQLFLPKFLPRTSHK